MPNIEDLAAFDPNTMEFPSWFSKFELFIRLAFSSCLWIVHAPLLGLHDVLLYDHHTALGRGAHRNPWERGFIG